jgi:hypothetical protein
MFSNVRNLAYGIDPIDTLQSKKIAGRILPAIATTTSAVASLSAIEMIKLIQTYPSSSSSSSSSSSPSTSIRSTSQIQQRFTSNKQQKTSMSKFKNSFFSLGLPFFAFSEPVPAAIYPLGNKQESILINSNNDNDAGGGGGGAFNSWDVFEVNKYMSQVDEVSSNNKEPSSSFVTVDLTLSELIKKVEEHAGSGSVLKSISSNGYIIYSTFNDNNDDDDDHNNDNDDGSTSTNEKKKVSFTDICLAEPDKRKGSHMNKKLFVDMEVLIENEQGDVLDFPTVRYYIPPHE